MSIVTVVKEDNEVITFKNVMGHQIGNGAVQVMMEDGTQKVFNNFREVFIDLDKEDKKAFKNRTEGIKAAVAAEQAIHDEPPKEAVALDS